MPLLLISARDSCRAVFITPCNGHAGCAAAACVDVVPVDVLVSGYSLYSVYLSLAAMLRCW